MPLTSEEIQAQNDALQLNQGIRSSPPLAPPVGQQTSIDTLLADRGATVKYSDSGSGGALLVKPSAPNQLGAAIKTEALENVRQAQLVGNVMESFFNNAQGTPPIGAPRVKSYDSTALAAKPQVAQILDAKMKEAVQANPRSTGANDPGFQAEDERNRVNWIADVARGNASQKTDRFGQPMGILVMEMAKGEQMNKMTADDKAALYRSEAFARSVGKAMAPIMAVGLKDHMSATGSGLVTNASNLLYDKTSGTLSVIDYDTHRVTNPSGSVRMGGDKENRPVDGLKSMRTFLEDACSSPQKFDAAIEKMCRTGWKKGEPQLEPHPFSDVMQGFSEPLGDMFFERNVKDKNAATALTAEDKRQFAMNLLAGAIEGMEYVKNNHQHLENAVLASHETLPTGEVLEHFYTTAQLNELRTEVNKLQPQALKTQLENLTNAKNLKVNQDLSAYLAGLTKNDQDLAQKLTAVQTKINRIENTPTTGDKLKKALTSKNHHPLDKLKAEERQILKDQAMTADLRVDAATQKDRSDFVQQMQGQKSIQPQPRQVALNQPTLTTRQAVNAPPKATQVSPKPRIQATTPKTSPNTQTDSSKPALTKAQQLQEKFAKDNMKPTRAQPRMNNGDGNDAPQRRRATARVKDADPSLVHNQGKGEAPKVNGPKTTGPKFGS